MDRLKEYIKSLVYEMLDEEESGAGEYQTPKAFKKQNEIQGFEPGKVVTPEILSRLYIKHKDNPAVNEKVLEVAEKFGINANADMSVEFFSQFPTEGLKELVQFFMSISEIKKKPSGRRFIPPDTILPGALVPGNFKIIANGEHVFLMISPLAKLGLEAITRGRTNRDTNAELPRLAKLFSEKMPQMTRGLIKASIKTSRINKIGGGDWIPVEVEITGIDPVTKDITLKIPNSMPPAKGKDPEDPRDRIQNPLYEDGIEEIRISADPSKKIRAELVANQRQIIVHSPFGELYGDILKDKNEIRFQTVDCTEEETQQIIDFWNLYGGEKRVEKQRFLSKKKPDALDDYFIQIFIPISKFDIHNNIQEQISEMIEEALLKESTYNQFKSDIKYRTKNEQLHRAIKEVKSKLNDINRLVEYTSRMKSELSEGEEGLKYWKATSKNVAQIAETITQLSNKIKNLSQ